MPQSVGNELGGKLTRDHEQVGQDLLVHGPHHSGQSWRRCPGSPPTNWYTTRSRRKTSFPRSSEPSLRELLGRRPDQRSAPRQRVCGRRWSRRSGKMAARLRVR